MAVTNRNSTLYTKLFVTKSIANATDLRGRVVPIPFKHTVVSGETGGASALVRDTVNLCVIPADYMVIDLQLAAENIWASAGVNGTLQLGDSGDDDRYIVAAESYTAAGGPIATEGGLRGGQLAFTGQNYIPSADAIVLLEWRGANPTVGKIIRGAFITIAGA